MLLSQVLGIIGGRPVRMCLELFQADGAGRRLCDLVKAEVAPHPTSGLARPRFAGIHRFSHDTEDEGPRHEPDKKRL